MTTRGSSHATPPAVAGDLAKLLDQVRVRTLSVLAPLSDHQVHDQVIEFLSPLVWDLAHIGNVEELWLVRHLAGRPPMDPGLDRLYNPFEQPRQVRGSLPLLDRAQSLAYLDEVRRDVLAHLPRTVEAERDEAVQLHRMIAQHELQHLETMLQAIGIRSDVRFGPAVSGCPGPVRRVDEEARVVVPAGRFRLGTDDRAWSYDNERPAHPVWVGTFAIDRYPATTRRYAAFISDGGYQRPELWTQRGWTWLQETGHAAPQGWEPDPAGGWRLRRFGVMQPLDPTEPVQHISWFEADAFARWAGGRLPTEDEWEKAASWDPATGSKRTFPWGEAAPGPDRANVGSARFGPVPVGSLPPGASAYGVEHLAGDVYEWTSSPFVGYPGFEAHPYREYSEVFFGGDYRVLRGCSWAIGAPFARTTYRNWDHPYRRQLMAGVRVAHDV